MLWPETVRALLVHSARWTDQMRAEFYVGGTETARRLNLLRHCGYGIPSLERALWSAADSLTLIIQDELQPFEKTTQGIKSRDMRLHRLPWPREALLDLGALPVRLRVTLSYFIEPNPGQRGEADKYAYHSHPLRFEARRAGETAQAFLGRINRLARDEEYGTSTVSGDTNWAIGDQLRRRGSLHADVWSGTAADLADRGILGVYPAIGWWRRRTRLERYNRSARYAFIVSIEAPDAPVDLYAILAAQIGVAVPPDRVYRSIASGYSMRGGATSRTGLRLRANGTYLLIQFQMVVSHDCDVARVVGALLRFIRARPLSMSAWPMAPARIT